ncbi:MAG: hypothetical protein IS632_01835 [Thaumarchaeota archaeon]|nr:hypothetical protein [Nitrososphaerota archaeon]
MVAVIGAGIYGLEVAKAGEVHTTEPRIDTSYSSYIADGTLDTNREVIVDRGGSVQLPVDIYAALDESMTVGFGVSLDGWETPMILAQEDGLPAGIHIITDQSSFIFPVSGETGISKRGSTTVTITTDASMQPGKYPLSLVLYELKDGSVNMSIEYFTLLVE